MDSASGSGKRKRKKKRNRNQKWNRNANRVFSEIFNSIIPNERQENKRNQLIEKIRKLIKTRFRYSNVYVYGSYASRTALYTSDIDIGINIKTKSADEIISQVENLLQTNRFDHVQIFTKELLINMKHEEIFFVHGQDRESKMYVDLSLNNETASFASSFVRAVIDVDMTNRMFIVLIKRFAQCQDLNDVTRGTLSSIGHTYLAIMFLTIKNSCPQFLKNESTFEVGELSNESQGYKMVSDSFSRPTSVPTLGKLLLGFFTYYSDDDIFKNMAISLRGGCLVSKKSLGWSAKEPRYSLGIVDPFSGDNVGSSVTDIGLLEIQTAFRTAQNYIQKGKFEMLFTPFKL